MAETASQPILIDPAERDYRVGLSLALFFHAAIAIAILVKGLAFPGKPIPYIPALRVDVVGLPDFLKKDLDKIPKEIDRALKQPDKVLPKEVTQPRDTSKGKASKLREDEVGLKPKTDKVAEAKAREKKLKSALDRIKSLEKIKEESGKPKPQVVVKGNQVSKGTSLSANAKETAMSGYYDLLRDKLQENWALPVWLARQKYAAQVLIYIDGRGNVRNLRFTKFSGNAQFDDAVKKAIKASEPFPPPPEAIANSALSDGVLLGFPL